MRTFKHDNPDKPFKPGDMLKHNSLWSLIAEFIDYTPCDKPYASCDKCLTAQMQLRVEYSIGSPIKHTSCSTDLGFLPHLRWRRYENI